MPLTIAPTSCFTPSIFYDPNHNPRNIPCEGPKVVTGILNFDSSVNPDFTQVIDLTQLMSQGQISTVQSMSLGLESASIFAGSGQSNGTLVVSVAFGGTNQTISKYLGLINGTQPSFVTYPVCSLNPTKIMVSFYVTPLPSIISGSFNVPFFLYNYTNDPLESSFQFNVS